MVEIFRIIYWNGVQRSEDVNVRIEADKLEAYRTELARQHKCLIHFEYKTLPG